MIRAVGVVSSLLVVVLLADCGGGTLHGNDGAAGTNGAAGGTGGTASAGGTGGGGGCRFGLGGAPGAGGVGAGGGTGACATSFYCSTSMSCALGAQYCSYFGGGAGSTGSFAGAGGTSPSDPHSCVSLPSQCANDPTCACLCSVLNCHTGGLAGPFCTCSGSNGLVSLNCISG